MRERWHWVSACDTYHILISSTWVVSVYLMCGLIDVLVSVILVFAVSHLLCDVWCVMCEYRERHWSWGSGGTESVLATRTTSYPPLLELWVKIDVLVGVILMCDVSHLMCDVCDVWVQITTLELRERWHWVSACNTCHNLPSSTWVVSVYLMCSLIDVLVGVILMCGVSHLMCDVCDVWCVMCDVWVQITRLELREWGHWVSACNTCHNLPSLTWVVSVYLMCSLINVLVGVILMCDVCHIWCVMCEYREQH